MQRVGQIAERGISSFDKNEPIKFLYIRFPEKLEANIYSNLLEKLDQYCGEDDPLIGNKVSLNSISHSQLEIIRNSLNIARNAATLPKVSSSILRTLEGIKAVLEEFLPMIRPISAPLTKAWNAALQGLTEAISALKINPEEDD
jgi:hypothetical protein